MELTQDRRFNFRCW